MVRVDAGHAHRAVKAAANAVAVVMVAVVNVAAANVVVAVVMVTVANAVAVVTVRVANAVVEVTVRVANEVVAVNAVVVANEAAAVANEAVAVDSGAVNVVAVDRVMRATAMAVVRREAKVAHEVTAANEVAMVDNGHRNAGQTRSSKMVMLKEGQVAQEGIKDGIKEAQEAREGQEVIKDGIKDAIKDGIRGAIREDRDLLMRGSRLQVRTLHIVHLEDVVVLVLAHAVVSVADLAAEDHARVVDLDQVVQAGAAVLAVDQNVVDVRVQQVACTLETPAAAHGVTHAKKGEARSTRRTDWSLKRISMSGNQQNGRCVAGANVRLTIQGNRIISQE